MNTNRSGKRGGRWWLGLASRSPLIGGQGGYVPQAHPEGMSAISPRVRAGAPGESGAAPRVSTPKGSQPLLRPLRGRGLVYRFSSPGALHDPGLIALNPPGSWTHKPRGRLRDPGLWG